ncbi:30S ribosomal protein S18 [Candidatus Gottesmanbacteria bacterium]|nr:30S ribosomal protein S18 [Candidatus Gottesmanbacteria bacterium]
MIRRNTRTKRYPKIKFCYFCQNKLDPSYEDLDNVKKFISERGKILPRLRTGLCNKHQVILTTTIKRARYMAFLPYIVRPI